MKRKFTADDAKAFVGAMQFLEMMADARTHYTLDSETGRGTVQVWIPGSEIVLHLEEVDVRHIRVVERNRQKFPDPRS
jgi:hypothetical protein